MVYETSYEVGRKPFKPDVNRGSWANPKDFIWACMGMSLKVDVFSLAWANMFDAGIYSIIFYFICCYLYVVPLMVLQAFMGQFSSSAFISAFRLAPLFKGLGYICLILNCIVIFYYTILGSVPLFFMLNSLRPTLPWSCEAKEFWTQNLTKEYDTFCNSSITKSYNASIDIYSSPLNVPSVLYFSKHFDHLLFTEADPGRATFSFELMACIITIWSIIAAVFYSTKSVEKLGTFLRYALWLVYSMLFICLVRFSFLPGATESLYYYIFPRDYHILHGPPVLPTYVMNCFGGGFGSITALASHNNFKTNIIKYSWLITVGQLFVMLGLCMIVSVTDAHYTHLSDGEYFNALPISWSLFLSTATAIAEMSFANFWSLLFYSMLTLCAIILICIQVLVILTSLFDEFELFRTRKQEVTLGLIACFGLCSLYFCSNYGLIHYSTLSIDALFTQTTLSLLLIFVVLWVYGRQRFQRDMEFMLNQSLGNIRIFLLRFIAPLCLLLVLLESLILSYFEHLFGSPYFVITTIIYVVLPWLILPIIAIYLMLQNSGSFLMRFKRACRPIDWYPVDPEQRQKYEEAMENTDITHQLTEVVDVTEEVYF